MNGRTIAIGDIHGCSTALQTLLRAVEPGPEDLIITLGDYVNRGPDSQGVLDRLIDLRRRTRLVSILGNHDEMRLQALGPPPNAAADASCGLQTQVARSIDRPPSALADEHVAFLERCVDWFETDDHIFVHANYDPDLPMTEQPIELLRWRSLRRGLPRPHASGKVVVAGHTSQKNGKILNLGHLVCIDTYCYGGEWLTALDVHSGATWQADLRGRLRQRGPVR